MTAWQHAIVHKKVLSRDSERWLICCWDTCDNDGYELYKAIFHDHPKGMNCNSPLATHLNYVFCCENHRLFFGKSHLGDYGNLDPRMREGAEVGRSW
jgi:hypothetical protein